MCVSVTDGEEDVSTLSRGLTDISVIGGEEDISVLPV